MSKCPKCGRKLRLTDISQFCPGCGVNMRFYNFEENFIREAKLAEMLRNLRYSFSGSRLVTAKLIVMLLPLLSLLIPSGNITISLPFVTSEAHFGILGIVNIVTGGSLNYIFEMCSSAVAGAEFTALRNALFGLVAVALLSVFCFLFSFFGFISIRNMQKITTVTAALGIIATVADIVLISVFKSAAAGSVILTGSLGFGLVVTALMFVAVFTVNLLLWKNGIHPVYDEGVEERVRIYKEVKAGRINIDDLPQPVVETEATRKIDEAIAKEEAAFYEKFTGEVRADV